MKIIIFTHKAERTDAIGKTIELTREILEKKGHKVKVVSELSASNELDRTIISNYYEICKKNKISFVWEQKDVILRKLVQKPTLIKKYLQGGKKNEEKITIDEIKEADKYIFEYGIYYTLIEWMKVLDKSKIIIDFHGITEKKYADYSTKYLLNKAEIKLREYGEGCSYIVHSKFMQDEVRKLITERNTCVVIPLGVRMKKIRTAAIQKGKILYVGRVARSKNIETLIRAFVKVKEKIPYAKLSIVGRIHDKPYVSEYKKLMRLAETEGVKGDIQFKGLVSEEKLLEEYQESEIMATASFHEGFCIPIIEAQMQGKPVIASKTTAIQETIGNGGMLCNAENVNEFANSMIRVLSNKKKYNELSKRAEENAKKYSAEIFQRNILKVIEGRKEHG